MFQNLVKYYIRVITFLSLSIFDIIVDHEILLKKCQELGLIVFEKTYKYTHKQKLMDIGLYLEKITILLFSNEPPPLTISASAPGLSMLPDNLQEILSAVIKSFISFIPPPAPFSSVQRQRLTQPRLPLLNNFEDIDSESSHSQGAVV